MYLRIIKAKRREKMSEENERLNEHLCISLCTPQSEKSFQYSTFTPPWQSLTAFGFKFGLILGCAKVRCGVRV